MINCKVCLIFSDNFGTIGGDQYYKPFEQHSGEIDYGLTQFGNDNYYFVNDILLRYSQKRME